MYQTAKLTRSSVAPGPELDETTTRVQVPLSLAARVAPVSPSVQVVAV